MVEHQCCYSEYEELLKSPLFKFPFEKEVSREKIIKNLDDFSVMTADMTFVIER